MSEVLSHIAQHALSARWEQLSVEAKAKLKLCILANLSVAVAGLPYTRLPPPTLRGSSGAYFLFSGERTDSASDAAFFNGTVMHARNQDDFHPNGRIHIGTLALPAAFVIAERNRSSGLELLDSMVAAYAVGVGLTRKFAIPATRRGFRTTGIFGPFPAVAAAAQLAKLNQQQTEDAFAIATSLAGGPGQCWIDGSDEWQLHVASSARTGVEAVHMAQFGTRGAHRAFDGTASFYQAAAGVAITLDDLKGEIDGERAIIESVVKRYSVSGINQTLMVAAERLLNKQSVNPQQVSAITIRFHADDMRYPGTTNMSGFKSFSDAMMSAPFTLSAVIANGGYSFAGMFPTPNAVRDQLIAKVTVQSDTSIPVFGVGLDIRLQDGRILSEVVTDPAADLEIDWSVVDAWAGPMWDEAGRGAQFALCKEIVNSLERRPCADLFALLSKA